MLRREASRIACGAVSPHVIDTASGLKLSLDNPQPDQIALKDIAGGLARVCRFGAQALRFHSVAQHAILVSCLVEKAGHSNLALAALHHDSHEAYVCDIPSPLKRMMEAEEEKVYDDVCNRLDDAIVAAFDISPLSEEDRALIKRFDDKALMMEAADLLLDRGAGIAETLGLPLEQPEQIGISLTTGEALDQFLGAHQRLAG